MRLILSRFNRLSSLFFSYSIILPIVISYIVMLDIFNKPISLNPITLFQNNIYSYLCVGKKRYKKKLNQLFSSTHQNWRREKSVNFQRHLFSYHFFFLGWKYFSTYYISSSPSSKNASKFISVFPLFSFLWCFKAMTLKNGSADLTWKACIRSVDEFRI